MAGKLREKARGIRKRLFSFFCFCSATSAGEAPRQQEGRLRFAVRSDLDEFVAVPAQSETRGHKLPHQQELRLTSVLERRLTRQQDPPSISVPRQQVPPAITVPCGSQNVERRGAIASILEQVTGGASPIEVRLSSGMTNADDRVPCQHLPQAVSIPCHQSQNGERKRALAKTEIASILEQVTDGRSSASIDEVNNMYEFIERALTVTRRDLPVFQPSHAVFEPRPIFTPRVAGAVFEPLGSFMHGARFGPGRLVA